MPYHCLLDLDFPSAGSTLGLTYPCSEQALFALADCRSLSRDHLRLAPFEGGSVFGKLKFHDTPPLQPDASSKPPDLCPLRTGVSLIAEQDNPSWLAWAGTTHDCMASVSVIAITIAIVQKEALALSIYTHAASR